jgi:formate dehydrogenase subunit gamma
MRIRLQPRSAQWTFSFFSRGMVVLTLMFVAVGAAYVLAEVGIKDPAVLWKDAVANSPLVAFGTYIGVRASLLVPAFGILIAAFIVISLGHFFIFGPKDMSVKGPQDAIPWWTLTERIVHAVVLISFLILAVTGLVITFGRYLGGGSGTLLMRQTHEMAGFVFSPFIALMILLWVRHAIPRAYDVEWLKHAGGYLGYKGELLSGKFNAGQKLWYWIMAVTCVLLVWTGLSLYFQYGTLPSLRMYVVLHLVSTIPLILMFVVHLYMTTLGAKGAFSAMVSGKFSQAAAKKFHADAPETRRMKPSPAGGDD